MKILRPLSLSLVLALCGGLLALVGCADLGVSSLSNPPGVSAQQTYTTQSVTGIYSYVETGVTGTQPHSGSGTLTFDGKGNITGTVTDFYLGSPACQFTLTGTYSITSSAAGTGTYTANTTNPSCTPNSGTVNLQVAEQGQTVLVAESDGQRLDTGTAVRQ